MVLTQKPVPLTAAQLLKGKSWLNGLFGRSLLVLFLIEHIAQLMALLFEIPRQIETRLETESLALMYTIVRPTKSHSVWNDTVLTQCLRVAYQQEYTPRL